MNDRDLREALAPLHGDPVQDAARVLKALPPRGPGGNGPRRVPPLGWWLLGSGLVLGALAGMWLARGEAPAAPQIPPPAKPLPVEPVKSPAREELMYLMSMGKVHVEEPGAAPRDLEPGAAAVALGTTVTSDAKTQAGLHVLGDDARVQLDHATVATVAAGEVRLQSGRVLVATGAKDTGMRVVSDLATVRFKHAEVVAERQPEALLVIVVNGTADVGTPGGRTAQLDQGMQVVVDSRGIGESQKVPSLAAATSWIVDPQMPRPREDQLYLFAFGKIHVDEPGVGPQDLAPGAFDCAIGTTVATDAESRAGIRVYANDVRLRLDHDTTATADVAEVRLRTGQVSVATGGRDVDVQLVSDLAIVLWRKGEVIGIREPTGLAVIAVAGEAIVRTPGGQSAKLNQGLQVFVDRDRGISTAQKVPFLGTATSWMTDMILQEQDETALNARVREMVEAYTEGSQRQAAAREIRKLGSRCVSQLVQGVARQQTDPDYARATAVLAAEIADYRSAGWLFQLLELDDPEVRAIAYRGIVRATGIDGGTDENLWRNGSSEQRQAAIAAWWKLLK